MRLSVIIKSAEDALKDNDQDTIYRLIQVVENWKCQIDDTLDFFFCKQEYEDTITTLSDMVEIINDMEVEEWITLIKDSE